MSALAPVEAAARSDTDRALPLSTPAHVEPPFFSQVGMLLTLRCPVRCEHCMVQAGPHRREEMTLDRARDWIEQAAACGVESVGFTGGEPFYCWDKLLALAQAARRLGMTNTVVTNGYWAETRHVAVQKLARLQPSDVSVSTDLYHVKTIPLERVENVYRACRVLGIRCDLTMAYTPETLRESRALLRRVLRFAPQDAVRVSQVYPSGRGAQLSRYCGSGQAFEQPPRAPCLFASVPYLLPSGHVVACVGPAINLPRDSNPLCLGNLHERSLAEICASAQENPVLHGLRIWGPRFWHRLVEAQGPRHALPDAYRTECPCEACVALLAKPEISAFLSRAVRSKPLQRSVGRARRVLLDEPVGD